ncbi:hypothetical protein VBD025_04700 [Virgibacillus flavescens]|uniref:hypothetical protein n=1 Tax=Virgibacillus flavescens TaxID=1611422 RepID=UPI003D343C4F
MNNRKGMMTSMLTIGATGAAIYGITKGVQNGTFKRMPQAVSNAMNNSQTQQFMKPIQNMANNQDNQQTNGGATQGWETNTTTTSDNQNNQF